MLVVDPSGRATDTRFVVAAEWVGVHTSRTSRSAGWTDVRFVAGGIAHALDSTSERVLCGAERDQLVLFAVDFLADPWALRCRECEQLLEVQH